MFSITFFTRFKPEQGRNQLKFCGGEEAVWL